MPAKHNGEFEVTKDSMLNVTQIRDMLTAAATLGQEEATRLHASLLARGWIKEILQDGQTAETAFTDEKRSLFELIDDLVREGRVCFFRREDMIFRLDPRKKHIELSSAPMGPYPLLRAYAFLVQLSDNIHFSCSVTETIRSAAVSGPQMDE
jgi:hypothetical protein